MTWFLTKSIRYLIILQLVGYIFLSLFKTFQTVEESKYALNKGELISSIIEK